MVEQALSDGQGGGRVPRITPKTGARKAVATGGSFISAAGIAVEANESILVTDANAFGGNGGVIASTRGAASRPPSRPAVPWSLLSSALPSNRTATSWLPTPTHSAVRAASSASTGTGEQTKVTSGKKFGDN